MDEVHHHIDLGPIEMLRFLISRLNSPTLPSLGAMSALSLPTVAAGLGGTPQAVIKKSSSGCLFPRRLALSLPFSLSSLSLLSVCVEFSLDRRQ